MRLIDPSTGSVHGPGSSAHEYGARPVQIVTHAIFPGLLPNLIGISLFRMDENVRSSLVLGFVGAGRIGFLILTSMNCSSTAAWRRC